MSLNITITSDFICPWCLIGERRLDRAIRALGLQQEVHLVWRPFELNPDMDPAGVDRRAYRSGKFGSWAHSQQLDAHTVEAAAGDDIAFDYAAMQRTPNTFLAHRLTRLAEAHGLATPFAHAVFSAYFEQGRDIGAAAVLTEIAGKVGLSRPLVDDYLAGDDGKVDIRAAESEARNGGVRAVPSFVIGDDVIAGAQPLAVFVDALRRATRPV